MTPTSPVVSEQRMEENLTGVYFWNKTLKPFAPCCQHLNLRVALKASPRRPNSQRPFEREPVLETVAEWDWRTGWRDAVLTQVVGETVALWRATTDEHGGWRCDKVKVKFPPSWRAARVSVVTAVGPFQLMAGICIRQCCLCSHNWISFYKLHLLI